jgi:hypothetical protein
MFVPRHVHVGDPSQNEFPIPNIYGHQPQNIVRTQAQFNRTSNVHSHSHQHPHSHSHSQSASRTTESKFKKYAIKMYSNAFDALNIPEQLIQQLKVKAKSSRNKRKKNQKVKQINK